MKKLQPRATSDLKCDYAPRVPEPALLALRTADFHPLFGVELVEREYHHAGLRRLHPDMLDELVHGGQIREMRRVGDQMPHCDQRMGLAASVGQFQLADGLVALAGEARDNVFGQFAQIEGRIGKGEEFAGVLVDRLRLAHRHVIEISGEDVQGKIAGLEVWANFDDVMPRRPREFCHMEVPIHTVNISRSFPTLPANQVLVVLVRRTLSDTN